MGDGSALIRMRFADRFHSLGLHPDELVRCRSGVVALAEWEERHLLGGRFLFQSGSHLILLDPSDRCARLVEVLFFRPSPSFLYACWKILVGR